jgi:thiol-disulfide isomerase/thioredoxin
MNKKVRKELIEIGLFLGVIAIIYLTGLQAEIAGFLQRGIMLTGLHNASVETPIEQVPANLDFEVKTLEGESLQIASLKGKTIFINFWATWCPPCIAEMPAIESLWQENKNDNIVFLLISTDDEMQKIKSFIDRKDFTFPVYQLTEALPASFNASAIPATFVVSPEGKLVYKHVGIANYHTSEFSDFLDNINKGI